MIALKNAPPQPEEETRPPKPNPVRERDVFHLIGSLTDDATRLIRKEAELAKTEISEKIKKAGKSLIVLIFGAATLSAGFVVSLLALSVGVVQLIMTLTGFGFVGATLIGFAFTGIVMTTVGVLIVLKMKKRLAPSVIKPKQTARTLKSTIAWVKEKIYE